MSILCFLRRSPLVDHFFWNSYNRLRKKSFYKFTTAALMVLKNRFKKSQLFVIFSLLKSIIAMKNLRKIHDYSCNGSWNNIFKKSTITALKFQLCPLYSEINIMIIFFEYQNNTPPIGKLFADKRPPTGILFIKYIQEDW